MGLPFLELQSVDSTNNYARQQLSAGLAQHGTAVFAHEQTAGKGQRGNTWVSEKDANIALSIVIKPYPLVLHQQFLLNACIVTAACEWFRNYAENETKIKWPNDLYWQDRKAGGVLIESLVGSPEPGDRVPDSRFQVTDPTWKWAIAGVGININQTNFPGWLPNPVSLRQITGKVHDPVVLAKELCNHIDQKFQELIRGGFERILSLYNEALYKRNEKVRLKKKNRVFEATIKGVKQSGTLIVVHATEEEIDSGEVEWL